jgi:hypothetical protein
MDLDTSAEDRCVARGADWIDSTSERIAIFLLIQVVLFIVVVAERDQRGSSSANAPLVPQPARTATTIVRLWVSIPWLFLSSLSLAFPVPELS